MITLNNLIQKFIFIAAGALLLTSCSNNEGSFVLRSDDHVDLDYSAIGNSFTVCTNGDWSVTSNADWFTASPDKGTGDGNTRETITIKPTQNVGAARTDTLFLMAAGKKLAIKINQAEGFVILGTPTFSGFLFKNKPTTSCYISVPYTKAVAGETYTAKVTMSGSSEGLTIADCKYVAESAGMIQIPVTGTPKSAGNVSFKVTTGLPNASDVTVNTIVAASPKITIFEEAFDKFIYGGDAANLTTGIWPSSSTIIALISDADGTGKTYDPTAPIVSCTQGSDGSGDVFASMSKSYRISRGVQDWTGSKVYERPGYLKISTGSAAGYITTPALTNLGENSEPQDVIVSLTMKAWYQNTNGNTPVKFTVTGGGSPSITSFELPKSATETPWSTVTFTIKGATSSTKLRIEPQSSNSAFYRFLFSDIKITTTGL